MDINKRKPRIINLRKKAKVRANKTPIKIHIDDPVISPEPKAWIGGTFSCIQCGTQEAQELGRCRACDAEHQKIVARMDAMPKQTIEKVSPKLTYRKEVSRGVVVTISRSEPLRIKDN